MKQIRTTLLFILLVILSLAFIVQGRRSKNLLSSSGHEITHHNGSCSEPENIIVFIRQDSHGEIHSLDVESEVKLSTSTTNKYKLKNTKLILAGMTYDDKTDEIFDYKSYISFE